MTEFNQGGTGGNFNHQAKKGGPEPGLLDIEAPPAPPLPPAEPFGKRELETAFLHLYRVIDYVLGNRDRLQRNVLESKNLGLLCLLLLIASILYALPYGVIYVLPYSTPRELYGLTNIALLYTGSLMICFPSLHVFSKYLGFKFDLAQNLALALVIPCVAGMFSFGFFPIIGFIKYTTPAESTTLITNISVILLTVSFFLGIAHLGRCFMWSRDTVQVIGLQRLVIVIWLSLLCFITYRMASFLELL